MIEPNRNGGFKRHESVDYHISMKLIVWTDNGILYCSNIIWGENIGNVPSR